MCYWWMRCAYPPYNIHIHPMVFMLALWYSYPPYGIHARPMVFMLALWYSCSPYGIHARANALKFSGKQNVTAEAVIPSGLQTFFLDAEFGRLFLKQI